MLELLSPAGSPEAVVAAVQNGADAIYMGFGGHNARRGAKNFSDEEFEAAVRYCRVRNCKVYVTLNTLVSDREMNEAVKLAGRASELGADAILVQDLGLARALHCTVPDIPLHASTQMSIHNLAGVEAAAEMGMTRAVLARELGLEEIAYICQRSPIEIEVFVHGALCFCHSGQCYMSALIGRRSGNRGGCAQPCRLQYSLSGRMDDYPLSLKDSCLVKHLEELERVGVSCVKIAGRMKRPEYSGLVTGIYSRAIKEKLPPSEDEMQQLKTAFSRQGFTDGYYMGKISSDMFGVREERDKEVNKLYSAVRKEYAGTEMRRVPIKFFAIIKENVPSRFAVEDKDGNKVLKEGPVPQKAVNQSLSEAALTEQLYKTGGTPFFSYGLEAQIDDGLFMPTSTINEMRRGLLDQLTEERKKPPQRRTGKMPPTPKDVKPLGKPALIFQFTSADQLTEELAEIKPDYIYLAPEIFLSAPKAVLRFVEKGTKPVVVLPRIITDTDEPRLRNALERISRMGVEEALIGNMGHIKLAKLSGFELRGDFGLNLYNGDAMQVASAAGFRSVTASFEMRISQIRDMPKPINTELIAYGRLPLMVSEQNLVKSAQDDLSRPPFAELTDRTGQIFPVARTFGNRSVIYNTHKLYMGDKLLECQEAGIWGFRLLFTNESAEECLRVAQGFTARRDYEPNAITRGLYFRGVE